MAFQVDYPKGRHQNELCSIEKVIYEGQAGYCWVGDLCLHQTSAVVELEKKQHIFGLFGNMIQIGIRLGLMYVLYNIYLYMS